MKTIIQGKNVVTKYGVDTKEIKVQGENGELITVYSCKPEQTVEPVVESWGNIVEVDGYIQLNQKNTSGMLGYAIAFYNPSIGKINLSETEEVNITEKIYRADLDAIVLHTDKVLSEKEEGKEESKKDLASHIEAFNKMIIESDEKLLAYCNLHHLTPEYTDVDELFKIVYPDNSYSICEGELVVRNYSPSISKDGWVTSAEQMSTIKCTPYTHVYTGGLVINNN